MPTSLAISAETLECLYEDAYKLVLKGATAQEAQQLLAYRQFAQVHPPLSTIDMRAAVGGCVIRCSDGASDWAAPTLLLSDGIGWRVLATRV